MKRFHVHVAADNLKRSIGFYSALFAVEPTVIKSDYAKWMLDGRRVNFAISTRGRDAGPDHLGIQAENGTPGCARPAAASSNEVKPCAAMRNRKSPGLMIRPESRGKPSTLMVRALITVTGRASALRD
jgi:hypothetical protein